MAEDEAQLLNAAKKLPWGDRIAHKSWKARCDAYNDIQQTCQKAFSGEDPCFAEFGPLLLKALSDTNVAAIDKALEALQSFLDKAAQPLVEKLAGPACQAITSKHLKQRPATAKRCADVLLMFVELEQGDTVAEALIKAFNDKVPKVVQAATEILCQAFSEFGSKVISPQPLLKALPSLFEAKQEPVRDVAKKLTVNLAGYLGPKTVQATLLDKMPESMRKEIEKIISDAGGERLQPSRFTKKEQALRASQPGTVGVAVANQAGKRSTADLSMDDQAADDPYDFAEPVNVLDQINKDFWEGLAAAKWTERRDALQSFFNLASKPKLATGDYGDVLRELRKVIVKDSNVVCVAEAIGCIGVLAGGLRANFAHQAKAVFGILLEKLKEKNLTVCNRCSEALTQIMRHCICLADVVDDLVSALDHKNPKVRLETCKLLQGWVAGSTKANLTKCQGLLLPSILKASSDAAPDIREAAIASLAGLVIKQSSAAFLEKVSDKLDEPRRKKLEELVAAAKSSTTTTSASQALKKPLACAPLVPKESVLSPKNVNTRNAPQKSGPPRKGPALKAAQSNDEDVCDDAAIQGQIVSKADAEEQMTALLGPAIVQGLSSANWKDRLASMDELCLKLQEIIEAKENCNVPSTILIQGLSHTPGWGEKNFQVLSKVVDVVTQVASNDGSLSKQDAYTAIKGFTDKIADIKLKAPVCEGLSALSEALGPQFVFTHLHKHAAAHKNPKVLSESLLWMGKTVDEFGVGVLNLKSLIDWFKGDLQSTNATVRNAAVSVLGTCHRQLGPSIAALVRPDLKPAQVTVLEEVFAANPQQLVAPTRKVRCKPGNPAKAIKGSQDAANRASSTISEQPSFDMNDFLPRTDISSQVTPRLLSLIASSNWKERNSGLEEVEDILKKAGGLVQPNVGDLIPALKARLGDSNANLIARTLLLLGDLAKAVGPAFDKLGRVCLAPALLGLNDKKKQVRDGVITMLDGYLSVTPSDRVLPILVDYIVSAKSAREGKAMGIQWLASVAESGAAGKCLDSAVRASVAGINDKNGDVREAGVELMAKLLQVHGQADVKQACSHLDSAARTMAMEAIKKVLGNKEGAAIPAKVVASAPQQHPEPADVAQSRPNTARSAKSTIPDPSKRDPGRTQPGAGQSSVGVLAISEKKDDRARKGRFKPLKFEPPREDEEEYLQQELGQLASQPLKAVLFSKDFRKTVEAVELLIEQISSNPAAVVSSMDLLLRWVALRLCDPHGNTTAILKVLELCRESFNLLANQGTSLSQHEASCIFPTLIEKSGNNQDRIRQLHKDLLRSASTIYPMPRMLEFVCAGLSSKNSRTRIDCAEFLTTIISKEGMTSLSKLKEKPFPLLAMMIVERDKSIRAAALGFVEALYLSEGPGVLWSQFNKLTEQQKSLVEERLKYLEKAAARQTSQSVGPSTYRADTNGLASQSSQSITDLELPGSSLNTSRTETPARVPSSSLVRMAHMETPAPPRIPQTNVQTPVPPPTPALHSDRIDEAATEGSRNTEALTDSWAQAMMLLHSEDLDQTVEGMKLICYELMDAANRRPNDDILQVYTASANELVIELTRKVEKVFDMACMHIEDEELCRSGGGQRSCKYTLNALLQAFQLDHMARNVAATPLKDLISVLLMRLLDDRVPLLPDGAQLLKALNVLMLKMLDHSNRTFSFQGLLYLLRCPPVAMTEKSTEMTAKFTDLVVKCLIKLTKSLQATIQDIDLQDLMLKIHDFFAGLGVDEIRRRGACDDKPLRMVKTLLHELCKIKGTRIKDYMHGIPVDCEPAPIIHAYIDLNLQTLESAGLIEPTLVAERSRNAEGESVPLRPTGVNVTISLSTQPKAQVVTDDMSSQQIADRELALQQKTKAQLAGIFKLIGGKTTTNEGIEALYKFQHANPDVDLAPHLAKTSAQFRQYIERGLQRVSAQETSSQESAREVATDSQETSGFGIFHQLRTRMEQARVNMAGQEQSNDGTSNGPAAAKSAHDNIGLLQERLRNLQLGRGL